MADPHDSSPRLRVLAVCTANVCRSPTVERLLRHVSGGALHVESAGTRGAEGASMDPRAASEIARLGGDPTDFRANRLTVPMIESADVVLTASLTHRADVCAAVPRAVRRTFTLRELAALFNELDAEADGSSGLDAVARATRLRSRLSAWSHEELELVDPVDQPDAVFADVADKVWKATQTIAGRLMADRPSLSRP